VSPRLLTAALAAMLAVAACAAPAPQARPVVQVAAAADLTFALDHVLADAADALAGLDVRVTYGSSGQFVQQIRNGAPFDLYLSADKAYVDDLVAEGLAAEPFDYAVGRIVTWYPRVAPGTPGPSGLDGLTDPSVRTVSIANPQHAPYGRAAVAALASAGLQDEVGGKLVYGENVAQAVEFARTGNADAAIVALSLVLGDRLRGVGSYQEVPLDAYPRIDQAGALLTRSDAPEGARLVRDVLTSEAGRATLAEYGFFLPLEPP
jgi:molybdate transport system substrate-binding protein